MFESYQQVVYGFAWRMTGSPEIAQDIAQDCFLQVLKGVARYDSTRGTMHAWLLGIARNLVLKKWRAEGRWRPLEEEVFVVDPPRKDYQAESQIANAVQCLPPLQREVLIFVEYEGFTLEEAACAVDAEVGTVKARLHRARNNLRRVLEPLRSTIHDR